MEFSDTLRLDFVLNNKLDWQDFGGKTNLPYSEMELWHDDGSHETFVANTRRDCIDCALGKPGTIEVTIKMEYSFKPLTVSPDFIWEFKQDEWCLAYKTGENSQTYWGGTYFHQGNFIIYQDEGEGKILCTTTAKTLEKAKCIAEEMCARNILSYSSKLLVSQ